MIKAEQVRKRYGSVVALDGVDLEVRSGEILAILGPNGAGKTTLLEILEGFQRPDSGKVTVLGADPYAGGPRLRERVGVMLQECEPEPNLSVGELLELYRGYYRRPRSLPGLLELVGLEDKQDCRIRSLSGGQRRRLDLAVALVGRPELIFMDEPTTGFDPQARQVAWRAARSLRDEGATIVLTTHYLEEAESLADRLVVLSAGKIRAEGTPDNIGSRLHGATRISFRLPERLPAEALPLHGCLTEGLWTTTTEQSTVALHALTTWAVRQGVELEGLSVSRPSLQDAYLELIR